MKLGRKWLLQIMINEQPADFCDFVLVHLSFGFQPNLITKTQRKTQKHGLKDRAIVFFQRFLNFRRRHDVAGARKFKKPRVVRKSSFAIDFFAPSLF